jgi:anthranilate synthase component 2
LPVHGKVGQVYHREGGIFRNLPSPFVATRYHSLIVERSSLPGELEVTAELESGMIMGAVSPGKCPDRTRASATRQLPLTR